MNPNLGMPVLDLELWVQDSTIYHSFYKKKVSSQYTILKRSALSYSIKKNTMLQEALRRLGNIPSNLPKEETTRIMTKYSNMLRISRYTERERWNFIKGAVLRHREMLEEIVKGERTSLYRDRKQI